MKKSKLFYVFIAILISLGALASGVITYVLLDNFNDSKNTKSLDSSTDNKDLSNFRPPRNWTEYKFANSSISIYYPKTWSITALESSIEKLDIYTLIDEQRDHRFMISLYHSLSSMPSKEADNVTYRADDKSFEGYSKNMIEKTVGMSVANFEKITIANGDGYSVSYEKSNTDGTNFYLYHLYSRSLSADKAFMMQLSPTKNKATEEELETFKQLFSSVRY